MHTQAATIFNRKFETSHSRTIRYHIYFKEVNAMNLTALIFGDEGLIATVTSKCNIRRGCKNLGDQDAQMTTVYTVASNVLGSSI